MVGKKYRQPAAVIIHHAERFVREIVDAAQPGEIFPPLRLLCNKSPFLELNGQIPGRHRAEEIEALHLLTSDFLQELVLFLGFDALCQSGNIKFLRHAHNGSDDLFRPLVEVFQESHVQLQLIERVILQNAQGRVPGPEIVHPHIVAQLMKPTDERTQFLHIPDESALGNLQISEFPGHAVLLGDPVDGIREIIMQEILPGQIHRDR